MVTFILKNEPGKDKLIFLTYYFAGQRFKYSTTKKIPSEYWNPEKGRARGTYALHRELNAYLQRLTGLITLIHLRLDAEGTEVTPARLREELNKALHKTGKITFIEYIQKYIEGCGKPQTSLTIFKTVFKHLRSFPGAKNFTDIDLNWLNRYTEYLEGKNFSANYISKNIAVIRQFLNEATEAGYNHALLYKTRKYKMPGEETETIYLTNEELDSIWNADLPKSLSRVRYRFLTGAYTALRFSDFNHLKPENIEGDYIVKRQKKTNETVIIPLHYRVREIIEKHPESLYKSISNQKMNDYLKLVCDRAGIKKVVIKSRTKGGVRTEQAFQKWELVTTHTARRTAATNMYLAGIPVLSIMKITGHRTEKSFMRYIRISKEENARHIASHSYFTGK